MSLEHLGRLIWTRIGVQTYPLKHFPRIAWLYKLLAAVTKKFEYIDGPY